MNVTALPSSPDLKLVKDTRNQELLARINAGGYPPLMQLAQEYGISPYYLKKDYGAKGHGRGRPKASGVRLVREAVQADIKPRRHRKSNMVPLPVIQAPSTPKLQIWAARIFLISLGGVCAYLNYQYSSSLGKTGEAAHVLGYIGLAIDTIPMGLPTVAAILWKSHKLQSIAAWLIVAVCSIYTLIAGISFGAVNIGDRLADRAAIMQHRNMLESELAIVQADRLKDDGEVLALEHQIQIERGAVPPARLKSSDDCKNTTFSGPACLKLNQLRIEKDRLTARLKREADEKVSRITAEIAAIPAISGKFPGGEFIERTSRGFIHTEYVQDYQVGIFAFMTIISGLLLVFVRTMEKWSMIERHISIP